MSYFNGIRSKVSGPRKRFKEDGYNIDLSYICMNRIIVMSYPASGAKSMWRNDIKEVRRFLEEKHLGHFYVFNVSEKPYDWEKFDEHVKRVSNHNW